MHGNQIGSIWGSKNFRVESDFPWDALQKRKPSKTAESSLGEAQDLRDADDIRHP